jgi:hypothetical protein
MPALRRLTALAALAAAALAASAATAAAAPPWAPAQFPERSPASAPALTFGRT